MIKDAVFFTEKQGRSDMLSLIVKNRSFNSINISKTDLSKKLWLDSADVGRKMILKRKNKAFVTWSQSAY